MIKKLFRKSFVNISFVGIGNMFNAALGFLFLSVAARSLEVDQFGRYALLASLLISLSKILDFGTNSVYVAKAITTQDKERTNHFITIKVVLFFIALLVSLMILHLFGLASGTVLLTFVLGLFFYGINYTLFGLFQKIERYTIIVLLHTIPALIKGLFAVLILLGLVNFTFENYFMVFSFAIGPSAILYIFLPENLKKLNFDFTKIITTIKEAISPGISQLINEGFPAISNSLAKIYSNFTNVGLFSLADKISNVFVLVSFTIFTVLLPKNALRKRDKQGYDYTETAVLSIGVLLLSFVTIIFAGYFVPWFFQDKYNESLSLLNILVFAGAIGAIHTFMENYFFVEDKTKYLAYISGGKLVSLLILSLILIPTFSLKGLAWAHLLASIITLGIVVHLMSSGTKDRTTSHP